MVMAFLFGLFFLLSSSPYASSGDLVLRQNSVPVLIKMRPLSLFFGNYLVFQEPFLYLSGDWSVWGLSDCNQF